MRRYCYRDIQPQRGRNQTSSRKASSIVLLRKFLLTSILQGMAVLTTGKNFYSMKRKSIKYFGLLKKKSSRYLPDLDLIAKLLQFLIAVEKITSISKNVSKMLSNPQSKIEIHNQNQLMKNQKMKKFQSKIDKLTIRKQIHGRRTQY